MNKNTNQMRSNKEKVKRYSYFTLKEGNKEFDTMKELKTSLVKEDIGGYDIIDCYRLRIWQLYVVPKYKQSKI
jgi:hypothetical protein